MQLFNPLTNNLIRTQTTSGSPQPMSLPEVYSGLMRNEVESFPVLRPHQRHPWHAFLVQLGAMAMHKRRAYRAAGGRGRLAAVESAVSRLTGRTTSPGASSSTT